MKSFSMVFTLLAVLALTATQTQAWDGQRKGFILGVGLGTGFTSFTQSFEIGNVSVKSDPETKAAVMTDFKIGYAWDNQWMIFYNSGTSWFSINNALDESVTISSGVAGIALSHYFQPTTPSWFLTGTLGYSGWNAPFEEDASSSSGFGIMAGGGYEFSRHWYVQGDLDFGNPSDEDSGVTFTTKATTLKITVNVLGY